MKIRDAFISAMLGSFCLLHSPTYAATWFGTSVGNDETRYYFDADTVSKTGDIVLVWVKIVQTRAPDRSDGSWASAMRWRFSCNKRTIQSLTMSIYDKNGNFIQSSPGSGRETELVPDSTGEAMLKIACEPDFPKNKSGKTYYAIADNDVFAATKRWVEWIDSQKDSAPK